ncbi:uncharacterized protein TRAVEDRAFT_25291, partial [Trametes versicolor FP-101664 SS1]|uniref:uncharacterized protein n=1 Tax=Trametes versicolor (strain FP-101664) TaxID=717944 RepID=UPI0004622ACA
MSARMSMSAGNSEHNSQLEYLAKCSSGRRRVSEGRCAPARGPRHRKPEAFKGTKRRSPRSPPRRL